MILTLNIWKFVFIITLLSMISPAQSGLLLVKNDLKCFVHIIALFASLQTKQLQWIHANYTWQHMITDFTNYKASIRDFRVWHCIFYTIFWKLKG